MVPAERVQISEKTFNRSASGENGPRCQIKRRGLLSLNKAADRNVVLAVGSKRVERMGHQNANAQNDENTDYARKHEMPL